jgi:CobQ-like glutamine amidotransferase family enzyme
MTERKAVKPPTPHKPSPKTVAARPVPTDYQKDPADPFPLIAAAPAPAAKPPRAARAASPRPTTPPRAAGEAPAPEVESSAPVVSTAPAPKTAPVHSPKSSHSRDHRPLRIAHLYPSLLNVAGDGGNLIAIQRRAQWRGIPVEVVAVEKAETPDFRKFDIVLFHGGQDVEMAVAADDFAGKAPSLREAVDEGVVVFAVCAGLQLLGHRYVSNAGEEMIGAGILDLETRGGPQRFMQHAACEVTIDGATETVVGFENHSGLTTLGPGCEAFGTVIAGAGNNGRDGLEGARSRNVFATYLHGPCLPKNPWLTDQLIRIAVGRAEGVKPAKVVLAPLNDELEVRAHEVALAKAMANRGRRTALEPAKLVRGQKG